MPLITWDETYSVGIKEIDAQHQKLFALVNELDEIIQKGGGKDVIAGALGALIEFKRSHFASEERLMSSSGYPGFSRHKIEHDSFTQKLIELQGRYLSGQATVDEEVLAYMEEWLNAHILDTDKKYVPYLISKGII